MGGGEFERDTVIASNTAKIDRQLCMFIINIPEEIKAEATFKSQDGAVASKHLRISCETVPKQAGKVRTRYLQASPPSYSLCLLKINIRCALPCIWMVLPRPAVARSRKKQ